MKPWNTWLCGLGLCGALAFGLPGCGGGDVPDPASDALAATDDGGESAMPPPPPQPAPPGDAVVAPAEPVADATAAPAAIAELPAAADAPAPPAGSEPPPAVATAAPDAPAAAETPAAAEPETPAVKSDTAELLAMATGAAAPAPSVDQTAAVGEGTPGGPGGPGALGAEPDAGQLAIPGGPGPYGGREGETAAPGGFGPEGADAVGGLDGEGGMPGSGGASELKPGDVKTPQGAVEAFLYALSKKDRDRLQEATALRSTTVEEGGKYRELFSRILDLSISDSELDDLATKLEGYRHAGFNQVKSTGRLGVTIRKQLKDGGWLQRTVTVRREKKGWGVLDITGATEFENMRVRGTRRR